MVTSRMAKLRPSMVLRTYKQELLSRLSNAVSQAGQRTGDKTVSLPRGGKRVVRWRGVGLQQ